MYHLVVLAGLIAVNTAAPVNAAYKYVIALSVDGLHGSDVGKYVALKPKSTIASLLSTGYEYQNALTSGVGGSSISFSVRS